MPPPARRWAASKTKKLSVERRGCYGAGSSSRGHRGCCIWTGRTSTCAPRRKPNIPLTQCGRMCQQLEIRITAASSPQAKRRIERAHGTHHDRLVKKLRLAVIASYQDANVSGGALPEPVPTTRTSEPALGAGQEPRAGGGRTNAERSPFTIAASGSHSTNCRWLLHRGARAGTLPPRPLPQTLAPLDSGGGSSLATRLAANENNGLFLGTVKTQPRDISMVDKPGTFLMWYDNAAAIS